MNRYDSLIETRLQQLLQRKTFSAKILEETSSYTLLPGKKFRPLLVISLAENFAIPISHSLDPACAIEMIHAFSLIHDDLPCMDNDDFRRGSPTLHKVYGEALALLTGDFLLSYAFETLTNAPYLEDVQRIQLIQKLSKYTGGEGMITGQILDLFSADSPSSTKQLLKTHYYKTASLLCCCCEFVSILAKLPASKRVLLKKLGTYLGIAYQIQDDLLDFATENSSDNTSAISLWGIKQSQENVLFLEKATQDICHRLSLHSSLFQNLLQKIFTRKS